MSDTSSLLPHLLEIKGAIGEIKGQLESTKRTTSELKTDINGYRSSLEEWKKGVEKAVGTVKEDQDKIKGGIRAVKAIGVAIPILSGATAWVAKHLGS